MKNPNTRVLACLAAVALFMASSWNAALATTTDTNNAPQVYYTDIVSGPNTGGENGKGIYLSIFGKNFGNTGLGTTAKVFINGVEVDNYRYLGVSKGRTDIQQITVQIGALGNPTPGIALPVKVVVNGLQSNTDQTFTVNPGRILFVDNVAGKDALAEIGNITKPFRYVQTPALYSGGAWPSVRPGDFIVMRGHGTTQPWTDVGFENFFLRFRDKSGSAPTGAAGTGPIAIMGYPGDDVYLRGTVANGMTGGCISGINGQAFLGMGQWGVVSNLRIDCEGYDGPISQEVWGHNWRVVNNDLAASTAPTTGSNVPRMAGITGNGDNVVWYGNHIHDVQGSSGECHGVYIDGDGSYDIAYNNIHDIRSGNGFQVYVNGGNGSDMANNISLHHNLIHDVSKHGINIADNMRNNLQVWNNIVYNAQYAALRFNTNTLHGAKIYNNTFFNTNLASNTAYGAITNDWNLPVGSIDLENNIFYVASHTPYNSGSNGVPANAGTIARNLWFNGSGSTQFDSAPIVLDPQFMNAAGADFHLQTQSPAIGNGSASVLALVSNDYDLLTPRTVPFDIGALQAGTGGTTGGGSPMVLSIGAMSGLGSVTSAPAGINCGANCSASFAAGTAVVLTATPATDYTFASWGGACAGTTSTCSLSMDVARMVTAKFVQQAIKHVPINTGAPQVSGNPMVGLTLSCSTGVWSYAPTSYSYQWTRASSNIKAARSSDYTVQATDVGQALSCTVTAQNATGSAKASANTVLGVAGGPLLSPQIVQVAQPVFADSATRPIALPLPSAVRAGDLVLVAVAANQGHTYNFTVSDNLNNGNYTWYPTDACEDPICAGWFYVVAKNGGSAVSINAVGGAGQNVVLAAYVVSNFDSALFDGNGATAHGVSGLSSISKTTASDNSLVLSVFAGDYGQTIAPTHPVGALAYTSANSISFGSQYTTAATAGTAMLAWSVAQPTGWLKWAQTAIAIKGRPALGK